VTSKIGTVPYLWLSAGDRVVIFSFFFFPSKKVSFQIFLVRLARVDCAGRDPGPAKWSSHVLVAWDIRYLTLRHPHYQPTATSRPHRPRFSATRTVYYGRGYLAINNHNFPYAHSAYSCMDCASSSAAVIYYITVHCATLLYTAYSCFPFPTHSSAQLQLQLQLQLRPKARSFPSCFLLPFLLVLPEAGSQPQSRRQTGQDRREGQQKSK
jgi:hypothetical protein